MARVEEEREDLLREATALRERVELALPGWPESVTCGFRSGDVLSIYFGQDPAYHFDSDGGLRRAFAGGLLYRSQGQTLARLTRIRTKTETTLARHDLSLEECGEFLRQMREHLRILAQSLASGEAEVRGQVPPEPDLRLRLLPAVQRILDQPPHLAAQLKK